MGMSGDTALVLAKNYVKKTLQGQGALKGQDGFSPIIEENADNTDKIYKLDITTANSAFTTPNLRGKDGEGSGGETNVIESISVNGVNVAPDENKNVDITVPEAYDDTEVKGSIEGLNSNLEQLEYDDIAGGKNKFDLSSNPIIKNVCYDSDGNFVLWANYSGVKEYISVDENTQYIYSHNLSSYIFTVVFYDANKTLLSSNIINGNIFTTPSKCCYIKFSIYGEKSPTWAQIEQGGVGTDYEPYIPSVKMLAEEVDKQNESLSVIGKCKNLLNPTLQTTTLNGVTCTNNGDGTYTLNGTATNNSTFIFANADDTLATFKGHSSLKLVGFPKKYASAGVLQLWRQSNELIMRDRGDGVIITGSNMPYGDCNMAFIIYDGAVTDGMIIKPMLTTDLSATYDDFVSYTGDGDTLTHDVAELKNDLGGLSFSASGTTLTITDGTNTWTLGAN